MIYSMFSVQQTRNLLKLADSVVEPQVLRLGEEPAVMATGPSVDTKHKITMKMLTIVL